MGQTKSADGENERKEKPWPDMPKIANSDEFNQSLGVAQLAVRLCSLKKGELQKAWEIEDRNYSHERSTAVTDEQKKRVDEKRQEQMQARLKTLDPVGFFAEAWNLINNAREHVLGPQTDAEYLANQGGSKEALTKAIGGTFRKRLIPFQKLCDPKREPGDTEPILDINWKVYRSERGFDVLFADYWRDVGERWRRRDSEIGTVIEPDTNGELRRVDYYSPAKRAELADFASDTDRWKQHGEAVLASWKRHGVRRIDVLGLNEFRRRHDARAENLPNIRKKLKKVRR